MSLDATRWAWLQKNLRPIQKLILLALADRADASDCAFPSYETLCEDTGADRKSVWAALKEMAELGIIQDTGQRKGATGKVAVWKLIGVEHRADVKSSQKRNDSKNGIVPFFPANGSENGTVNGSENGTQNLSVEPTKESESKNTRKPKSVKTNLPEDFFVSERVAKWFAGKGYREDIAAHLEIFASKARAKGYTYVDWDEAFMNAIRDDWAGLRKQQAQQHVAQPRKHNDWQARR